MEINKEKLNINLKAIAKYCFRVFVFLVLNSKYLITKINDFYVNTTMEFTKFLDFEDCILFLILFWLFYVALTIKLCGIFQKIIKLYLPLTVLIVLFVNILFCYICPIVKDEISINIITNIFFYVLPLYFFIYVFFVEKFITKKR